MPLCQHTVRSRKAARFRIKHTLLDVCDQTEPGLGCQMADMALRDKIILDTVHGINSA